ncbi:MAG: hypothetical protein ACYS26_13100 [Planctomycetota bacterium]|jgi:hypothetical protein
MVDLDDAGCLLLPLKFLWLIFYEFLFERIAVGIGRLVLLPFGKRNAGEFTAGMLGFGVIIAVCWGIVYFV